MEIKKYVNISLKVIFSLIMIFPIIGIFGIFPSPTREMYTSDIAFSFIEMLMATKYINYLMAFVYVISLFALWSKREPLAALLMLPITINIVGFHAFLDGGLFTAGAVLGNLFFLLNLYFLWVYRSEYRNLLVVTKKQK